jgi:hypothetical protein
LRAVVPAAAGHVGRQVAADLPNPPLDRDPPARELAAPLGEPAGEPCRIEFEHLGEIGVEDELRCLSVSSR